MRGYPQFSFWISTAPDMIYLYQIVIIWEKILPISGHSPLTPANRRLPQVSYPLLQYILHSDFLILTFLAK